jgi:hypothetical protein
MTTSERVPPALERALRTAGEKPVNLIVHTYGPAESKKEQVETFGFEVRRVLRLVNCLAVTGPASAGLTLAQQDWVTRIEEDREVRAL